MCDTVEFVFRSFLNTLHATVFILYMDQTVQKLRRTMPILHVHGL